MMDETTQMPANIAAAVSAVMGKIGTLAKDDRNKHGGYDFAGIDKFLSTVGPLCAEHGLIILMDETECETLETSSADDKIITWLRLGYDFTLAHSSGEVWGVKLHRNAMVNAKMGAQAFGAAQSYALKQFMRSLFQIPTGDGEDSDNHEQTQLPKTVAPKLTAEEWAKNFEAELSTTTDVNQVNALVAREQKSLKSLADRHTDRYNALNVVIQTRRLDLANEPIGEVGK